MVLALMYIMYPIAYPTALMLDFFLGESHGTIYKKAGNVFFGVQSNVKRIQETDLAR